MRAFELKPGRRRGGRVARPLRHGAGGHVVGRGNRECGNTMPWHARRKRSQAERRSVGNALRVGRSHGLGARTQSAVGTHSFRLPPAPVPRGGCRAGKGHRAGGVSGVPAAGRSGEASRLAAQAVVCPTRPVCSKLSSKPPVRRPQARSPRRLTPPGSPPYRTRSCSTFSCRPPFFIRDNWNYRE